jgi:lysozyme family protein
MHKDIDRPDARFAACLAHTRDIEGGWSDDPHDKGGPTMKGITIKVFAGWIGVTLSPANYETVKERLRAIPDDTVDAIYRANYWNAVRGDELPAGIDLVVWDYCVNSGPAQAVKSLQRAIGGLKMDGHLGAATLDAVRTAPAAWVIAEYMEERRRFLRARKTFWRFGKGWMARCDRIEAAALAMVGQADPAVAAAVAPPLPDPDAQSATQAKAPAETASPPWVTELVLGSTGLTTSAGGFANAFAKLQSMADPTPWQVALAFLSEPLVIVAVLTTFSAFTTLLWRRRVAA